MKRNINKIDKNKENNYMETLIRNLVILGVLVVALVLGSIIAFDVTRVRGNQLGVKENWSSGVNSNVFSPATYFLPLGTKMYVYPVSANVFVMSTKNNDSYLVQSAEGQDMTISLNLRWRIDPSKLIYLHTKFHTNIEEILIRPVVMRIVKDAATKMSAIKAYSGEGLVELQTDIQRSLAGSGGELNDLASSGVIVENFVIEHIALDPKYIDEIKLKQIATQRQLRAIEEQKAAEADALVAKAKAQADFNTKIVEAERDAKVMVVAAQAENEKAVIAAQAQQKRVLLEAEGQKQRSILEADGIKAAMIAKAEGTLAQGKAEANAKELMLKAYMAAGTNAYVQVEVAKSMSDAYKNISGYLPHDLHVTTLTENFMNGVKSIVAAQPAKQ